MCSCIYPPGPHRASVLSQEELVLVSTVKKGKDYVAGGRFDLAEREFRRALALNKTTDSIYNDLAFVLQSEERYDEAEELYLRAIALNPQNINAHDNLARLYYQTGRIPQTLEQYAIVRDLVNLSDPQEVKDKLGREQAVELYKLLRLEAMAYYALGLTDEALACSSSALVQSGSVYEAGQHARMLLALEKVENATRVLRETLEVHKGDVPKELLLDYGLALYVSGESSLAKAALTRLLSQPGVERGDARTARLVKLLLAFKDGNQKEAESVYDTLFKEDSKLCRMKLIDRDNYWPSVLVDELKQLTTRMCSNERELFFAAS